MGKFFVLITQIRNQTDRPVGFRVAPDGYCPVPDLPPDKTRMVNQSRILRCLRQRGSDWKVRVLVDNQFTGIEFHPMVLLDCTRIVFRYRDGSDVLCVEGVLENYYSDFLLRLKYFGWMRNVFWDRRQRLPIESADSRVATKLRDIEGQGQHSASFLDITDLIKSSSILSPSAFPIQHEEKRKRDGPVYATVDRKINDQIIKDQPNVPQASPEKPSPPPPPPSPPPQMISREQDWMAEDSSDEDFWRDIADDSSSDASTDHASPPRAGRGIGRRVEANSPVRSEISGSDGGVQRARREQTTVNHHDIVQHMDGFEHAFLFFVALTFVCLLSMF